MRELPAGMREKVLAAAELFAEHGLDATKMEDVAAATGVPKATLYYYILTFLFTEILDEVAAATEGALNTEGNGADRLRAAIVAHLRIFEEFPAASRTLQFDLGRAARIPFIDERVEAAYRGPIRKLLEEGAADGSLRPVAHPRVIAVAILGAVTTVGINAISLGHSRSVEDIADDVIAFVLQGVAR
jgi:TetR/AcrR family transcriptional regulator